MTRATAIHPLGATLRCVTLERTGGSTRARAHTSRLPLPVTPATIETRADALGAALSDTLEAEGGPLHLVLPCGFFQTRKVPLEVADRAGRNSQIDWEIEQATGSPRSDFEASFFSIGSAAVWFSVRRAVREQLVRLVDRAGGDLVDVCPEPLALFYAARMAGVAGARRRGAILLGHTWSSFAVFEGDRLTAAEAVYHGEEDALGESPAPPSPGTGATVRRWLLGRGARPTRDLCERFYLCGCFDESGAPAPGRPSAERGEPLDPFAELPRPDLPHSESPCDYAAAAGAAYQAFLGSPP